MNIAPLPISTDNGWVYGYLDSSGNIATSSGVDDAMVSPYIPIRNDRPYTITVTYTLPSTYTGWIGFFEYDANKAKIGSRKVASTNKTSYPSYNYSPNSSARYIRVSATNLYNNNSATMSIDDGIEIVWHAHEGEYPINDKTAPTLQTSFKKPYPASLWRIDESNGGYPYHDLMPNIVHYVPREESGAFESAASLASVRVPISVKTIGPTAFAGTALRRVKIAADCTYEETSFPEGCVIERYPDDRYVQLYDSSGKAVLDYDARRVYVLKEDTSNG